MKLLTKEEFFQKYDSYLPNSINEFSDVLEALEIYPDFLDGIQPLSNSGMDAPDFSERFRSLTLPHQKKNRDAFRVLLLDFSQYYSSYFSSGEKSTVYKLTTEPFGLMSLATYLNKQFGPQIVVRVAKSGIDFDSNDEMITLIRSFNPNLIGARSLSYYREFTREAISLIWKSGFKQPIIAGGPYAIGNFKEVLQDGHVDVVALGEGELTLTELVESFVQNGGSLPNNGIFIFQLTGSI